MTRRTLLFLHPSAELYGADRTLLDLVRGIDREAFRAHVVLPREGSLAERLRAAGAEVELAPLGIGAQSSLTLLGALRLALEVPRALLAVGRIVRREDPSLIHTNTMIVLGGALAARLARAPHVWHVHELPTRGVITRIFARLFSGLADHVVFNSNATREHFLAEEPRLAGKSSVVLNGTQDVESGSGGAELRRELGVAGHARVVALVGRFNAWKGQSLLLEAAERLGRDADDVVFLLAGDAPPGQEHFERALVDEIARRRLGDRVHLVPFVDGARAVFDAADLVAVPSTRPEPFGLVAIEAMANAKPVIAAEHGGLREIVVAGETGWFFRPGDAADLARVLGAALDGGELERFGAAGRDRQRARFSVARYQAELHGLLARLACGSRSRTPRAKVVHVVLGKANPERANGVNVAVDGLARAQHEAGSDVEVWGLTLDPEAETPGRAYPLRLFRRGRSRFRAPRALVHAVKGLAGPAVFHLHGGFLPELRAVARLALAHGHEFVLSPHGAYREDALAYRGFLKQAYLLLFERPLLRRARGVQAFTPSDAVDVARQAPRSRVVVLPNGQDVLEEVAPRALDLERPVFGTCSRLAAWTKGLDLLVRGFAGYARAGGTGSLLLVGDGPDREALEALATRLGVAEHVVFAGELFGAEKLALLAACDAFVLTSRHEGMPTASLEAAALGLPLVVSSGTGLGDFVRAHDAGWVLSANTGETIAAVLGRAAEELEAGRGPAIGDNARRMARECFSWRDVARRAADELYGLAGSRAA